MFLILVKVKCTSERDHDWSEHDDDAYDINDIDDTSGPPHDSGGSRDEDDDYWDDGDDDDDHPLSEAEPQEQAIREQRKKKEAEERKKKAAEAQEKLRAIEEEALKTAEEMIDALFKTYDLALKVKKYCREAYYIRDDFEEFHLWFREPIASDFGRDLKNFLFRTLPFSMISQFQSTEPLKEKILSNMQRL